MNTPDDSQRADAGTLAESSLPDTAMQTGSDDGEPGERRPVAPGDVVAAAVEDDAPLPPGAPGATRGGPQGDGLEPQFHEPEAPGPR